MNIVEWAFGKRMTPAERLRKHQRSLEKTQRELERERVKLENQEKKLQADVRKSAKAGQMGAMKIQAKDIVRTRRYCAFSNSQTTANGADTSRSLRRCARSCRPSRCASRRCAATSR
jgi:hypothetical protein